MSAHDAGYLTRETAEQPLHFVTQLDIAGRVGFDDVRDFIGRRLDELPLLHRRLRYPLLGGRPVWVDDAEFTAERHVTAWPQELRDAADADAVWLELTRRRLPRDRPLWQVTVAAGPGDATTVWLSIHHAMMDGSLLAVALRGLFPTAAPDHSAAWRPQRAPSRLWLLMLIGVRRIGRLAARRPAAATPIAPPPPHPTSLTGPVTAARSVAAMTVSLDGVQQARRRTGGTLNDHFLAIVTDALRVYLQAIPETVLALVPRNVRTEAEAEAVGNRAWSILVPLPTGEPDASKRMASIAAATEAGKQAPRTLGTQGWRFDIALTNVRLGGPFALCGRPVVRSRSSVPLQGENRLVGAMTTLGDSLTVAFTADGEVYPDVARLAELTQAGWQRLVASQ